MHTHKTCLQTCSWAISYCPLFFCLFIVSLCSSTVSDEFLVAVNSHFLVSLKKKKILCSYILGATFTRQHIRKCLLVKLFYSLWLARARYSFKCLNRWLPRSLEVKIKTCAWGLRAQNAIYSSSLISSGIPAWGLMVLGAHAHLAKNNSQMVIFNFEVAYRMKAFHCEQCCRCKSWKTKLHSECLQNTKVKLKILFLLYWEWNYSCSSGH